MSAVQESVRRKVVEADITQATHPDDPLIMVRCGSSPLSRAGLVFSCPGGFSTRPRQGVDSRPPPAQLASLWWRSDYQPGMRDDGWEGLILQGSVTRARLIR